VNSFCETLVRGLNANGVDAQMIFPELGRREHSLLPNCPRQFLHIGGAPLERQWEMLAEFCERNAPCIIFPNYDYLSSAVTPALSDRVGVIGVVHSDDVEHYDHVNRLARYWNRTVCTTDYLARQVIDINPGFSKGLEVIPYGVAPSERIGDRQGPTSTLKIVYCGRLIQHQKRVGDLVAITRELDRRAVDYRLTLIGEGPEEKLLRSGWKEQIAAGKVVLKGRLSHEQVLAELENHDVMLLVSAFEGMPVALMEAIARGLVSVVSDIPAGIPELVVRGETGFVASIGDVTEFADHLERLAGNTDLLHRMSAAARAHFLKKKLSEADMVERYTELVNDVWRELIAGTYQRPASLIWNGPAGRGISPPGSALHVAAPNQVGRI
jgi:glycosyltransferase involved in cell wall biosynthesis